MTTIACTRKQIASDLQVTSNGTKFKATNKIYSCPAHELTYPKPFLVGYTGTVEKAFDVIEWLAAPEGKPPGGTNSVAFLALTEDGKIFTFQKPTRWIEIDQEFCAIGSGGDLALAAMAAGKSPHDAVLIACEHDVNSGFGADSYDI